MKTKFNCLLLVFSILTIKTYSQKHFSNVVIEGDKKLILSTSKPEGEGKLSSGEIIKSGYDHECSNLLKRKPFF